MTSDKDLIERLRAAFKQRRYGVGEYEPDFDLFDVAADVLARVEAGRNDALVAEQAAIKAAVVALARADEATARAEAAEKALASLRAELDMDDAVFREFTGGQP